MNHQTKLKVNLNSRSCDLSCIVRKNIEKVLATQIQEVAMVLRKQQKGFLDKMKDQNFNGTYSELNVGSTAEELVLLVFIFELNGSRKRKTCKRQ